CDRVPRHGGGFAFGDFRVRFPSGKWGRAYAFGTRVCRTSMGHGPFLCAQDARDLAHASEDADYVRPVPLLAEYALSRRTRVQFLRCGTALRVANCSRGDRFSPSPDGSFCPPGGTTVRARFRCGVGELQQASAPMALVAGTGRTIPAGLLPMRH